MASDFTVGLGLCFLVVLGLTGLRTCSGLSQATWLMQQSEPVETHRCPPSDIKCNDGRCIHARWRCDGQRDCRDGSDEKDCEVTNCSDKQFRCDTIRCIPVEWRCDGQSDCLDGSDELQTNCRQACPSSHFQCPSGQCINIQWKCDGERDCKDGADEDLEMCAGSRACFQRERPCKEKGECIDLALWCDGKPDCRDGSDEWPDECANITTTPAPPCLDGQFRCTEGRCISGTWVCDGMPDCKEGEDEKTAECATGNLERPFSDLTKPSAPSGTTLCKSGDFTCADGDCVPSTWRCDGSPDCADGSDERSCGAGKRETAGQSIAPATSCSASEFFCIMWNGTGHCLSLSKVCDLHTHDCQNGTDEGAGCLTSCLENGQCSDVCHALPTGSRCSCHEGYELSSDGKVCIDINECETSHSMNGPCSQTCTNTRGSFKCGCTLSFTLEQDGVSCKADNDALLLYGADSEVNWMSPNGRHHGLVTRGHHSYVSVGIEYLEKNHSTSVFYSDSERKEIIQVDLQTRHERTVIDNLGFPEALTMDWIAQNLYYVDADKQVIGVCALRNQTAYCTTVVHNNLVNPRGIAVHATQKMLFFTQWGTSGRIERTWLDGSGRVEIVGDKVLWPNAVAIDFIHDRLYWIDARLNWIETTKLDGRDRRTVLHMKNSHPFGLTVLGDRLYWTDWTTKSIRSSRVNGSNHVVVHSLTQRPMGLTALHESRRPLYISPSACDVDFPNPCEQICLAKPGHLFTCRCHNGYQLEGSRRCGKISVLPDGTTHPPPRVIDFADSAVIMCKSSDDCDCSRMKEHTPDDICVCYHNRCERTVRPRDAPDNSKSPHPSVEPSKHVAETDQYRASVLAAIICTVVLSIIVIVLVVLLIRKYCISWIDPLDEKSLLEDEYQPRNKKSRPCPSVLGGFNNPTYENVTPSASSYLVKFYKSRMNPETPSAPETPVSENL